MAVELFKQKTTLALTGSESAAHAMRQIEPDVVAVYPITPQTPIAMTFAQFVADGLVDTELIMVESEHSALSATIGAAAAGAIAMTATASQGLALMWEMLYIASGLRLPIVMNIVTRALSAPINIHNDHSDIMGTRDSGWIQIFAQDPQEVYEYNLWAIKIAFHPEIYLPVMVAQNGFITSHTVEKVDLLPDKVVWEYVKDLKPPYSLLDIDNPITVGPLAAPDSYFEIKKNQEEAMYRAKKLIEEIGKELTELTGKEYKVVETYRMEDADIAIVVMGSGSATTKYVIDKLRKKGYKVGMMKIVVFRPGYYDLWGDILSKVKGVAVLDNSMAMNAYGGPLYLEIKASLYDKPTRPIVTNYIYGLGGRDLLPEHVAQVVEDMYKDLERGKAEEPIRYLGLKGKEVKYAG